MKHIHAELMLQYAQDAMETDKPWERWEYFSIAINEWKGFSSCPTWSPYYVYRRKQKTININGHEVPEPVKNKLTLNTIYYIANIGYGKLFSEYTCGDDGIDNRLFNRGLIHLTKEAAIKHAEALLSFTRIDK